MVTFAGQVAPKPPAGGRTAAEQAVLDELRSGPKTRDELAAATGYSAPTVTRACGLLREEGLVQWNGERWS